jgi:hypothetical protein
MFYVKGIRRRRTAGKSYVCVCVRAELSVLLQIIKQNKKKIANSLKMKRKNKLCHKSVIFVLR